MLLRIKLNLCNTYESNKHFLFSNQIKSQNEPNKEQYLIRFYK